jgi:hypothetical protein
VWPGTSKLIEEMGELQQILGKLIAVAGDTKHWDGDLRPRLIGEAADLMAALQFFMAENLTKEDMVLVANRVAEKRARFEQWHQSGDPLP